MLHTRQYPVFIDGEEGAYGVVFPDMPGIVAMGATVEEALVNAAEALADAAHEAARRGEPMPSPTPATRLEPPAGCVLTSVIVLAERQNMPPDGDATSH